VKDGVSGEEDEEAEGGAGSREYFISSCILTKCKSLGFKSSTILGSYGILPVITLSKRFHKYSFLGIDKIFVPLFEIVYDD
jgi:hypothetical protein